MELNKKRKFRLFDLDICMDPMRIIEKKLIT